MDYQEITRKLKLAARKNLVEMVDCVIVTEDEQIDYHVGIASHFRIIPVGECAACQTCSTLDLLRPDQAIQAIAFGCESAIDVTEYSTNSDNISLLDEGCKSYLVSFLEEISSILSFKSFMAEFVKMINHDIEGHIEETNAENIVSNALRFIDPFKCLEYIGLTIEIILNELMPAVYM
uniref:ORF1 n=1 Tax=Zoothera dauma adenovirus TaxID=3073259 RepID=A0AA51NPI9_9ADEN|nr:ORF1 [Zoothera dauma adenovirus]